MTIEEPEGLDPAKREQMVKEAHAEAKRAGVDAASLKLWIWGNAATEDMEPFSVNLFIRDEAPVVDKERWRAHCEANFTEAYA